MGHLARCIALAQQFKKLNFEIQFVGQFNSLANDMIRASGFSPDQIIKNLTPKMFPVDCDEKDAECVLAGLPNDAVFVVKDSYSLGSTWDEHIASKIDLLTFDDGEPSRLAAKIIVNPRLDVDPVRYHELNPFSTILTGPDFSLIPNYLKQNSFNDRMMIDQKNVAVCLGGGDHPAILNEILTTFISWPQHNNFRIKIVTTLDLQNTSGHNSITITKPHPRIWEEMADACIIICAGGNMLYESCFLGKSIIGVALNETQSQHLRAVSRELGFPMVSLEQLDKLPALISNLIADGNTNRLGSNRSKVLVDGLGPERIAAIVRQMCK